MKGYKMNQNESMNGDSALGDISVLSPSQRREQERRLKKQEMEKAAKAAQKAESARN